MTAPEQLVQGPECPRGFAGARGTQRTRRPPDMFALWSRGDRETEEQNNPLYGELCGLALGNLILMLMGYDFEQHS